MPNGRETSFKMCLKVPPDLITLRSTVTSAELELTLDKYIPIIVSVVDEATASRTSPVLVT